MSKKLEIAKTFNNINQISNETEKQSLIPYQNNTSINTQNNIRGGFHCTNNYSNNNNINNRNPGNNNYFLSQANTNPNIINNNYTPNISRSDLEPNSNQIKFSNITSGGIINPSNTFNSNFNKHSNINSINNANILNNTNNINSVYSNSLINEKSNLNLRNNTHLNNNNIPIMSNISFSNNMNILNKPYYNSNLILQNNKINNNLNNSNFNYLNNKHIIDKQNNIPINPYLNNYNQLSNHNQYKNISNLNNNNLYTNINNMHGFNSMNTNISNNQINRQNNNVIRNMDNSIVNTPNIPNTMNTINNSNINFNHRNNPNIYTNNIFNLNNNNITNISNISNMSNISNINNNKDNNYINTYNNANPNTMFDRNTLINNSINKVNNYNNNLNNINYINNSISNINNINERSYHNSKSSDSSNSNDLNIINVNSLNNNFNNININYSTTPMTKPKSKVNDDFIDIDDLVSKFGKASSLNFLLDHSSRNIIALSKTKKGSIYIQEKIDSAKQSTINELFEILNRDIIKLLDNTFSSFVFDKITSHLSLERLKQVYDSLRCNIHFLCSNKVANRSIQVLVKQATDVKAQIAISQLFTYSKKYFYEICTDGMGNYVIQLALEKFNWKARTVIIKQIESDLIRIVTNKTGLSIFKKSIMLVKEDISKTNSNAFSDNDIANANFANDVLKSLVDTINQDLFEIIKTKYGHYGLVFLAETVGVPSILSTVKLLKDQVETIGFHSFPFKVIKKILIAAGAKDEVRIIFNMTYYILCYYLLLYYYRNLLLLYLLALFLILKTWIYF